MTTMIQCRSALAALVSGVAFIGVLLAPSAITAQDRTPCQLAVPGALLIYGDVAEPVMLTATQLRELPQSRAEGTSHSGEVSTYRGPALQAVLAEANLPSGADMRGNDMLRYVVVEAVDGYRALYSLAELDSVFRTPAPILAMERDGVALDADAGPFQIIAPGEQRHSRWVRQVACLRIARDP